MRASRRAVNGGARRSSPRPPRAESAARRRTRPRPSPPVEDEQRRHRADVAERARDLGRPHRPGQRQVELRRRACGRRSSDSTAIATTARRSPWRFCSSPSQPSVQRHGGHHVAQNSTSTTRPARSRRGSACREVGEREGGQNSGSPPIGAAPRGARVRLAAAGSARSCASGRPGIARGCRALDRRVAARPAPFALAVEAEVLRRRHQDVVDEDRGISRHPEALRQLRVAVVLRDEARLAAELLDRRSVPADLPGPRGFRCKASARA